MYRIIRYRVCLLLLSVCFATDTRSQFLGGFFNQKGAQRKYMIGQVALYQRYLGYARKGYKITRDGLSTIKDIKSNEFDLHKGHYRSLKQVNPWIKKQQDLNGIITCCKNARKILRATGSAASRTTDFETSEQRYLAGVIRCMDVEIDRVTSELEMVIKPGMVQMSDDERIQKINAILIEARSIYEFSMSFSNDTRLMALQRQKAKREVGVSKKIYQLP